MSLNKVSAVVTPEQETQVTGHITDARSILDFLLTLSSQERLRMPKLSRGRVDFVDTSLVEARTHEHYLQGCTPLAEFIKDVELKNCLHRIRAEVNAFVQRLDDTIMVVEAEAYQTARLFYKSVKAAAKEGAEDAERIAKTLSYHYKNLGPSKNNDDDNQEAKPDPGKEQVDKGTLTPGING